MKIQRWSTITTLIICVISISAACFFNMWSSMNFITNIFLGVFSSACVVLILSVINYQIEKKRALSEYLKMLIRIHKMAGQVRPLSINNEHKKDSIHALNHILNEEILYLQDSYQNFSFSSKSKQRIFLFDCLDYFQKMRDQLSKPLLTVDSFLNDLNSEHLILQEAFHAIDQVTTRIEKRGSSTSCYNRITENLGKAIHGFNGKEKKYPTIDLDGIGTP